MGAARAVLLVGAVYGFLGLALGAVANGAASSQLRVGWRLAAWVLSGLAFAAHIAYAHARLGTRPASTALQASLAAALGAFLLAVVATAHARWIGASNLHAFALALVAWPVLTAAPAFVVALAAAAALAFRRDRV